MSKVIILFMFCTMFALVFGKHIHPRSAIREEQGPEDAMNIANDIPIDIIQQIKTSRFVPVNSFFSFVRQKPCEEGFKRDIHGTCREVWE